MIKYWNLYTQYTQIQTKELRINDQFIQDQKQSDKLVC